MSFFDQFVENVYKSALCICCLIILGPLLMGIGVWEFVSAPTDHSRQDKIDQVNEVIQKWDDDFVQQFSQVGFQIKGISSTNFFDLPADNTPDLKKKGLDSYKVLKYDRTGSVLQPMYWRSGLEEEFTFQTSSGDTFSVKATIFDEDTTNDSKDVCRSNDGEYDDIDQKCYYYYVLSGLCVKVSMQGHHWGLDTTYGGPGCKYSNGYPRDSGLWIPAQYRKVSYHEASTSKQWYFDNVKFMVRDQNDPYIFSQKLTRGTLNFGLTPGEKMAVGIALIVIGGCFTLPCIIFVCTLIWCCHKRGGYSHLQEHYV